MTTDKYERPEHDVLIIGAGAAGLPATIEALGQGLSVGVVCKSLLGKAHTVMAEGGMPQQWRMWMQQMDGHRISATRCAAASS